MLICHTPYVQISIRARPGRMILAATGNGPLSGSAAMR
jgi:hypothetical protein